MEEILGEGGVSLREQMLCLSKSLVEETLWIEQNTISIYGTFWMFSGGGGVGCGHND